MASDRSLWSFMNYSYPIYRPFTPLQYCHLLLSPVLRRFAIWDTINDSLGIVSGACLCACGLPVFQLLRGEAPYS